MSVDFVHRFLPGTRPFTLLSLHPSGGNENELVPICRAVAPGAAVLSPRLPPGVSATDLAAWIIANNAGPIYVFAYSEGADLALTMLLFHPGTIAGGVLLRPRLSMRPDPLPEISGVRLLIAAGGSDPAISVADSESLARLLSSAGAAVDLAVADSDHQLTPQDFGAAKRWFAALMPEQYLVERTLPISFQVERHVLIAESFEDFREASGHLRVESIRHFLPGNLDPHQFPMKARPELSKSEGFQFCSPTSTVRMF